MGTSASKSDTVVAGESAHSFTDDHRLNFQRLMVYAKSSDPSLQKEVAEYLANEAVHAEKQEQIVACGGLKLLVQLARSSDGEVQRLSAHALANLSALAANQRAIAEADGGLTMLVHLLGASLPEVQRQAAKTIANLSVVPSNMRLIAASGGLPPLIALLNVPHPKTRIEAIAAIANLAVDDTNEAAFVKAGVIKSVLEGLSGATDNDLLTQSLRALRNLTSSPAHAVSLRDLGGAALLESLAKHSNERVRAQADAALMNVRKVK